MSEEFKALDRLVKSRQMIVFFILMSICAILFYPILEMKRRKALQLQQSIKAANRSKVESFGGACLKKVD